MTQFLPTSDRPRPHGGTLAVHLLGLVDFDAVTGLQEQQIYELSGRSDTQGTLLLCEHPPLITMGREASRADLLPDDEELARRELTVRWVARGGGALVHGPGQLAISLQLPLLRLGLGLRQFRENFEEAVLNACRELKIPSKRQSGEPGIWSRGGQLAYFGAGVKSWISCHGMFLNVTTDPRLLELTVPNPLGTPSTSLQSQRLEPVRLPQVREALVRHICEQFRYDLSDVSTGHPLLKRTIRKVTVHV
ncbi:lipoyl protein ligase domain-containing protein [Planctomicrobium sp. SH664]|uniref:lipoyl protein ligase domain-containing protein n=1 Tax=Planctomicrobium sp. SH664 TaxID=3448125 RepID=UPI003F5BA181